MVQEVLAAILENQILVLGLGGLGLAAYYIYTQTDTDDLFDEKEPRQFTRQHLKKELENGQKVDLTLKDKNDGNLITRGEVKYKYVDKMPGDESISPVIDPLSKPGEKEADSEVVMLKVMPENKSNMEYIIYDVILGKDDVSEYYLLSKDSVQQYEDEIVIKEEVRLDYDKGVFTDRSAESENKSNMIIRLESQNEVVKGHVNYGRKVNHLSPKHSMDLEKIQEEKTESDER